MQGIHFNEEAGALVASGVCAKQLVEAHGWSPEEVVRYVGGTLHEECCEAVLACRGIITARCNAFTEALGAGQSPSPTQLLAFGYSEWAIAGARLARKKHAEKN